MKNPLRVSDCRGSLLSGVAAVALLIGAVPATALDVVTLRLSGFNNPERKTELETRLRAASLSAEVVDDDDIEVPVAQDVLGLAQADYGRLLSVLYTAGYYGPLISIKVDGREAADVDPFNPPTQINQIDISILTGPRFRFGTAQVAPRPADVPPGPIVSGFERGAVADSSLVASAANAGIREWREDGYPKADVADQSITAVHPSHRLNVDVRLDPGPQLRFGPLTVARGSEVSERRVRQIMGWPEGQIYSPQELRDAVNRLQRSGVFRTVTINAAEEPNPDDTLSYSLTLIDEKKRRFGFSAEYATLDGITVGGFWLHRNLFGGAERFRVDAEIANIGGTASGYGGEGGTDYSLGFRATRPGTFGADNDLFFYGTLSRTDDPEYLEDEATLGLGVSRYFDETLYGELAVGLRYSSVEDVFGDRDFFHIVVPGNLEWDRRDNEGDPTRGFYLDVEATPFIGLNGSKTGLMSEADGRVYRSVTSNDRVILAGRVMAGSVVGPSIEDTPPDFLFFSGGGDTVRGQPYQSLGVEQENGRQSGGKSWLGGSAEIRTRLTDSFGMVAFYDIGYIGPDSFINDKARMQSGTGLGARVATPIGPIRVDLGTPVDGQEEAFSRVVVYIGIGQAF